MDGFGNLYENKTKGVLPQMTQVFPIIEKGKNIELILLTKSLYY